MLNSLLIFLGKTISKTAKTLNLGSGSTWPGHVALRFNKKFISDIIKKSDLKIIVVAGTNGKTTTSALIRKALEYNGFKVIQNDSGANLLNGIASSILLASNPQGRIDADYAIFEVDENALPRVLSEFTPDFLLLLNLFRDQLDRYGEVNIIAGRWKEALSNLPDKANLILNADDPQIAYLGTTSKIKSIFFGLSHSQFGTKNLGLHAADSTHCPKCGKKLIFSAVAYSHIGDWNCSSCGLKRPEVRDEEFTVYPISGIYNKYNVLASRAILKKIGLSNEQIRRSFLEFQPAFGRQEVISYKGKKVQLFLSKNPTSFNQSYTAIKDLGAKTILLVLNDRIPDGRDVSWIWDVDLPDLASFKKILISGDRVYDMALRVQYEDQKDFKIFENLAEAIREGINLIGLDEVLYILPTYSAMLETRKILTGKKIS